MSFADKVLSFYASLNIEAKLPEDVEVMNPYRDNYAFSICKQFYKKFYDDNASRTIIIGINPGRFGGGITGVPFTDPIKLEQKCNISTTFKKQAELSADYIYALIDAYGGTQAFYSKFYFSAVSPLGFTQHNKNLNYYDIRELQQAIEPFALQCLATQLDFGINRSVAYCLGEGQNFRYLQSLKNRYNFFKQIVPLAHPRFIMQYKRKMVQGYIDDYVTKLSLSQ